jgi:oligopeptide/dipeptide ABC transporter ATP-binding protein
VTALLRVRDLRATFVDADGVTRAVDGVSFDLDAAETLGIVGESGAGKSVLALSLLRLVEPPGTIAPESVVDYRGTDLLRLSEPELRRVRGSEIAMVFQDPAESLNPVLRIGDQIVETLRAHRPLTARDARRRAIELLGLVGMPDAERRIDAWPHELSGGLQQRAMIAMALSCEPKILIADEPTTALDVTVQAQILELLAELKRRLRTALLLISHDLGVVARLADRVAVMYGGHIVEQAPAARLFADPQHPYTAALLAAAPPRDRKVDRLAAIPGTVPSATRWPSGCRFHPRCAHAWERCIEEPPPLLEAGSGHHARCWLITVPERRRP